MNLFRQCFVDKKRVFSIESHQLLLLRVFYYIAFSFHVGNPFEELKEPTKSTNPFDSPSITSKKTNISPLLSPSSDQKNEHVSPLFATSPKKVDESSQKKEELSIEQRLNQFEDKVKERKVKEGGYEMKELKEDQVGESKDREHEMKEGEGEKKHLARERIEERKKKKKDERKKKREERRLVVRENPTVVRMDL